MARSRKNRKNRKPHRTARYEVHLRAQIQTADTTSPDPARVVDTLNQVPNLFGLAVGTRDTCTRIEAQLAFKTREALLAWRNSSSLQELLEAVRSSSTTGNLVAMRVRRRKK